MVVRNQNRRGKTDHGREGPVRGAEYVRMSTEHQKYSTENQADAIRVYAAQRGIEIVRTYADQGKSGLNLGGRDALKQLIDDVEKGKADFKTILVYDVSRWGRFQDADEGAYYEQVCKRAGIAVQYCAEQFENDGGLASVVVKGLKRAMAGEYSRELSVKVFAGQCRLIELGYRQGGPPGYGLRRQLIDQAGTPKSELQFGEQKSIQTDRVVLVHGPAEEVEAVREIYRTFVNEGKSEGEIASNLNARGIPTDRGRAWTRGTIHQVLINEKYIGNNVWNRNSFKLKKKRVKNMPDKWIRADGVFEPLVEKSLFDAARTIIESRSTWLSDDQMLEALRALFEAKGYLSGLVIDEADHLPSSATFRGRFGSLIRAYQMVGFTTDRDYRYIEINRALREMHPGVVAATIAGIQQVGGSVIQDPTTDLLTINGEFTASIAIVRCQYTQAGSLRWHIRLDAGLKPDITIAVRMNQSNESALDYYLLPRLDMTVPLLKLAECNGVSLDAYRFETLDALFALTERASLKEVA